MKKIFLAALIALCGVSVGFGWQYSDLECSYEEGCHKKSPTQAPSNSDEMQPHKFDAAGVHNQPASPLSPTPRVP